MKGVSWNIQSTPKMRKINVHHAPESDNMMDRMTRVPEKWDNR